jgi:hypothetical protein
VEALQRGLLRIDLHIAGDTRSCVQIRQATPDELRDQQKGKDFSYLYEHSPPGGITQPVDPQSWGTVLALAIRDDRLVVEPRTPLAFPWHAYSFSIANPVVITELWPPSGSASAPPERKPLPPTKPSGVTPAEWRMMKKLVEVNERWLAGEIRSRSRADLEHEVFFGGAHKNRDALYKALRLLRSGGYILDSDLPSSRTSSD